MMPAKSQIQKILITNEIVEIIPRMPSFGENFLFVLNLIKTPRQQNPTNKNCWNRLLTSSTTKN